MKEQLQKDFDNTIKNLSLSQKDIEIKKFYLDSFVNRGFPNRKEEDWKFSDLSQIIKKNIGELSFYTDYTSTNKIDTSVYVDGLEHNKIVFINGRIEKIDFDYEKKNQIEIIDQSETIDQFNNNNSLSDLNNAFTNKSFKVLIKKGYQLKKPLIIYHTTNSKIWSKNINLRLNFELDNDSSLRLIDLFKDTSEKNFLNIFYNFDLKENAILKNYKIDRFESKNIKSLVKQIFDVNPDYHLLIVDDSSPDGTANQVIEMKKKYSNLYLETRESKLGLGTAYISGFHWALKKSYDVIIQMDADLSHDPTEIPSLISKLNEFDLIIGSRYSQGVSVVNWPIRRLMLSYGANVYTRFITGMPIKDGTGGFKAWRSELLKKIDLSMIQSQGYSFQIEMNFRAWILGARIKEEPIIFVDRTIGKSKMSKKIMYEAIWMVWRLRIWKILRLI